MKLTTIQLREETRKKIEQKKEYPKETYDEVITRMLDNEGIPTIDEMFQKGDGIHQKKRFSTQEVIKISHSLEESA